MEKKFEGYFTFISLTRTYFEEFLSVAQQNLTFIWKIQLHMHFKT